MSKQDDVSPLEALVGILDRCRDKDYPSTCYEDKKYGDECKYCNNPDDCTAKYVLEDLEKILKARKTSCC